LQKFHPKLDKHTRPVFVVDFFPLLPPTLFPHPISYHQLTPLFAALYEEKGKQSYLTP